MLLKLLLLNIEEAGFEGDIARGAEVEGFFEFGTTDGKTAFVGVKVDTVGDTIASVGHTDTSNAAVTRTNGASTVTEFGDRVRVATPTRTGGDNTVVALTFLDEDYPGVDNVSHFFAIKPGVGAATTVP